MKDSARERTKLTANYLNGIAIAIVVVFGFSTPLSIEVGKTFGFATAAGVWALLLAVAGMGSLQVHAVARNHLRHLDDNPDASKEDIF